MKRAAEGSLFSPDKRRSLSVGDSTPVLSLFPPSPSTILAANPTILPVAASLATKMPVIPEGGKEEGGESTETVMKKQKSRSMKNVNCMMCRQKASFEGNSVTSCQIPLREI